MHLSNSYPVSDELNLGLLEGSRRPHLPLLSVERWCQPEALCDGGLSVIAMSVRYGLAEAANGAKDI